MPSKKIVVSGNRPTGKLHWGNYFGAVKNWVDIQDKYKCYYFVADWHALTTSYDRVGEIAPSVVELLADWLAVGLDPKRSTIFIQSWILEHAELFLLLSMITPLGWLERVPSYKDMKASLSDRDLNMYGFLGYPLLQAADIVIYKANLVPVGEDQLAHLEFTRELVRRFSHLMKSSELIEPEPLLTKSPRVPGIDGRKMSKSFDNAIFISDSDEEVSKKMMQAITDPDRKLKSDPGHPDICNIFAYWKLYADEKIVDEVRTKCKGARWGCVECKRACIDRALAFWRPIREKRGELVKDSRYLLKIAREGSDRAREIARKTMSELREAFGMVYKSACSM